MANPNLLCSLGRDRAEKLSFQERAKLAHDVGDRLEKLMERWEQRILPSDPKFGDRFLAGEIHVLVLLRDPDTGKKWVLRLEPNTNVLRSENVELPNRKDEAVLVGIIELPEQPKRVVTALVRFEPIENFYRFPPRTLYCSALHGYETIEGMRDRELNLFPSLGSSFSVLGSDSDKLPSKVIESTSEVVNNVSDNCGNGGFQNEEWASLVKTFHVRLHRNRVELIRHPRNKSRFQLLDMLIGPFDFYADQSESVVGGHRI